MPEPKINTLSPKELHDKICEGMIEGIRREVQRRIDIGLPIHVSRNGRVEDIGPELAAKRGGSQ